VAETFSKEIPVLFSTTSQEHTPFTFLQESGQNLLGSADYLKAFEPHQLQALAYLALKAHDYGFGISLVFFGFVCLILGYLLFRSGYFPRTLGILMTIAGLSYLTNSFTLILAPTYSTMIFPILVLPFIGESSLCLWLIVKGVNVPKWKEKADCGA